MKSRKGESLFCRVLPMRNVLAARTGVEAVIATVRGSPRDTRASPSEQQCSPIEPDENSLPIPTMVQERGQSTLQRKMRSHTIENRFYAMSLDRPDISIFS
jgi:hypothetical protein